MSNIIKVDGLKQEFELVQFCEALRLASQLSIDEERLVHVFLPEDCEIPLEREAKVEGTVQLTGGTGTAVVLRHCGIFNVFGDLLFEHVTLVKAGEYFVPAFKVSGRLTLRKLNMENSAIHTVGTGNLTLESCSLVQRLVPSRSAYLFCMRLYSRGTHNIVNSRIKGFTGGIMMRTEKPFGQLTMREGSIDTDEFCLLLLGGIAELEGVKMKNKTGQCIKAGGKTGNISVRDCDFGEFIIGQQAVQTAKFYGGQHIILNRLRTALHLHKNANKTGAWVELIMTFVKHCFEVLPVIGEQIILTELATPTNLSLFAATYKINSQSKEHEECTLVERDAILELWGRKPTMQSLDLALQLLENLYEESSIDDEEFEQWRIPLEEMRHDTFERLEDQPKRNYLLRLIREDPWRAWYLLKDLHVKRDSLLRNDMLMSFLKINRRDFNENKRNFCTSWIGQWASEALGRRFRDESIPADRQLREAWANFLLDNGGAEQVCSWYGMLEMMQVTRIPDLDERVLFEAQRFQRIGNKRLKERDRSNALRETINETGHLVAMQADLAAYNGTGSLPGYTRRIMQLATKIEEALLTLSAAYMDTRLQTDARFNFCVAALDHHLLQVPHEEPKILIGDNGGYETCPICFSRKLTPWSQMTLSNCKSSHVFCVECFRVSMSTGSQELWGRCPGNTDEGVCPAIANRREMEMSGMPAEKIFNILRVRVSKTVSGMPRWRNCTVCQLGGSFSRAKYFSCILCTSTVTESGMADVNDRALKLKLLAGLAGNTARRGNGVFRECYHCAAPYEKGDACSTITCGSCGQKYNMTWGYKNMDHSFENDGIQAQRYVPKKPGMLWELGVFKDKRGRRYVLGQELNNLQLREVLRRAEVVKAKLDREGE